MKLHLKKKCPKQCDDNEFYNIVNLTKFLYLEIELFYTMRTLGQDKVS